MKHAHRSRRVPLLAHLAWVSVLLVWGALAWADAYAAAKQAYDARIDRPSLYKRMEGRTRLALTGDARALDVLAGSYAQPEAPEDRVRHLLVSLCARNFSHKRYLPRFVTWRETHGTTRDAWLWLESLRLQLWHRGADPALELIAVTKDPWLRAACIESLGAGRHPRPPTHDLKRAPVPVTSLLAKHLLAEPPRDKLARALYIEACSAVITSHARDAKDPQVLEAVGKLIEQLSDRKLSDRTALTIVRHLCAFFEAEETTRDPQVWRRYLAAASSLREAGGPRGWEGEGGGSTVAFAGLKATGTKIVYVIDASNSMLTPLGDKERAALRGVITPRGGKRDRKRQPIDWDKVRTRFDAVREFLKVSLLELPKGYHFAVILFGDKGTFLGGETTLQKVSRRSIRKAVENLDAIVAKAPTDRFEHGVLRGETNMHAGIRRALLVREKYGTGGLGAETDGAAYVDPELFEDGCDTIFVLSDGVPNQDDWKVMDRTDPGDKAVLDRESGEATQTPPEMWYAGPYGCFPQPVMLNDIRRVNLFRRVEIHCIGVGEADAKMLREISRLGNGRFLELNPPK